MARLLLVLVILAVVCMPLYAQCSVTCDKDQKACEVKCDKDKKACDEKCCEKCKDKKCCGKCDKAKKCDGKCEKDCAKCQKLAKLVIVQKCEKTGKEMVGIKLSDKQHAYLVKMFEDKKDKNGVVYVSLSKAQRAAILTELKLKAHSKVPVKKAEITECKHWVFEKDKAQLILSHKDKVVEDKVVVPAPKVDDDEEETK